MSDETGYIKCLNCGKKDKVECKASPMLDWVVSESKFINENKDEGLVEIKCTSCDNKSTIDLSAKEEEVYAERISELEGWAFSTNFAELVVSSIIRRVFRNTLD